jgi:hypothetical protein
LRTYLKINSLKSFHTRSKTELFSYLKERWQALFDAHFEVLLYALTSTYFEADAPSEGKRRLGYSRDKRFDCVQGGIALIVTPDGFPLPYEVMPGNTADNPTLEHFLAAIETPYGKANRVWVMERGIPTEESLEAMRRATVSYVVGTPQGRLTHLERVFLSQPGGQVRESVPVQLLEQEGELYVLTHSEGRCHTERALRRRRLKRLWQRLHQLHQQRLSRDELLLKLGAAKKEAGRAFGWVAIQLPQPGQPLTPQTFTFQLRRDKLRTVRRREGRYLLRCHLPCEDPAKLWPWYIPLTELEQAFQELKTDLSLRPLYYHTDQRIEAHLCVAFLADCLQVTLKQRLRALAPGLTPHRVLESFAALPRVDVHLPTPDAAILILTFSD